MNWVYVVAGLTVLRQLAAQGVNCNNLNTLNWIEESTMYWQCQAGIHEAYLDARVDRNCKAIYHLVKEVDAFVENFRPHLADKQGISAQTLAQYRPGIV